MPRTLPVTFIAGFLGAGKTSLLHHFVTEHAGGHVALLLEKTGELSVDARAVRGLCGVMGRAQDVVAEFSSGEELRSIVGEIARGGLHERALVEVSGLTQAAHWVRALRKAKEPVLSSSRSWWSWICSIFIAACMRRPAGPLPR